MTKDVSVRVDGDSYNLLKEYAGRQFTLKWVISLAIEEFIKNNKSISGFLDRDIKEELVSGE